MASETIRIGVVGAGNVTRLAHIPRFQAIDGVEVVSISNRTGESSKRVADEFGIPRVYDNWVDLIAAPDTGAICIGTWPYMHHTLVLAALEHDKHVLTQARMAMNAREAHEMLDASRRKPHLVARVAPFTINADRTIKELIADGYLGDIFSADLTAQEGFIDRHSRLTWRQDRDLSGYNTLGLGLWYETLMRWIGPASSVRAITRTNAPMRLDQSGAPRATSVPDHVEVLCEMASGPIAHMRISEVTGLAPGNQAWLFGSEGTLHLDISPLDDEMMTLYGGRRSDSALSEIMIPPEKQDRWRVEEEFIGAIRGTEAVPYTTFEDGVRYMEFTEAVIRSAQSGEVVYLPLR